METLVGLSGRRNNLNNLLMKGFTDQLPVSLSSQLNHHQVHFALVEAVFQMYR